MDRASNKIDYIFISCQLFVSILIIIFIKLEFNNIVNFIINLAFYLLIFLIPVFIYIKLKYESSPFEFLKLNKNIKNGLFIGLIISIFIFIIFFITNRFVFNTGRLDAEKIVMLLGLILAGFFEEVSFRGFYLPVFKNRYGFWIANLISSALFALMHINKALSGGYFQIAMLFILGLWLGYIYGKTDSLWAPIVVHAAYNVLTVIF